MGIAIISIVNDYISGPATYLNSTMIG